MSLRNTQTKNKNKKKTMILRRVSKGIAREGVGEYMRGVKSVAGPVRSKAQQGRRIDPVDLWFWSTKMVDKLQINFLGLLRTLPAMLFRPPGYYIPILGQLFPDHRKVFSS